MLLKDNIFRKKKKRVALHSLEITIVEVWLRFLKISSFWSNPALLHSVIYYGVAKNRVQNNDSRICSHEK